MENADIQSESIGIGKDEGNKKNENTSYSGKKKKDKNQVDKSTNNNNNTKKRLIKNNNNRNESEKKSFGKSKIKKIDEKPKLTSSANKFKSKNSTMNRECKFSLYQLLAVVIPVIFVLLFLIIYLSVIIVKNKNKKPKIIYLNITNNDNMTDVSDNNNNNYNYTKIKDTTEENNNNNISKTNDTTKEDIENNENNTIDIINTKDTTEENEEKNNDIITNIKEPTEEYNNINDKTDSIESTDKTTKENEKIKDSNEIDSTKEYDEIVTNDINNINIEEYDEFNYTYYNASYATLVPKKGYDHIYIHLGGIMEIAGYFSDFFKSNRTFIPKGTKIYYLSGKLRTTEYVKDNIKDNFGGSIFGKIFGDLFDEVVDVVGDIVDLPSWFNVDKDGNLICDNCNGDNFAEAKESLYFILDKIDQISKDENIGYDKIYLGGFSQGGIMTNYVLLNSRHRLGGYLAFSGYIFDHHFPPNSVEKNLNDEQKQILNSKKDYHILATHSFNDDSVTYSRVIEGYYTYYKDYTDFTLLSFGTLGHDFDDQPTHPIVRKWLKESMGK